MRNNENYIRNNENYMRNNENYMRNNTCICKILCYTKATQIGDVCL